MCRSSDSGHSHRSSGVDEILSSPLGKAVLGGLAAFAMIEMMDKDGRL